MVGRGLTLLSTTCAMYLPKVHYEISINVREAPTKKKNSIHMVKIRKSRIYVTGVPMTHNFALTNNDGVKVL